MKALKTTLAATVLGFAVSPAFADTYALNGSFQNFTNGSWVFGNVFTVGALDVSVTALGAYDAFGDGFTTPGGISVGIFDEVSHALLASANVTSTDTLDGFYRYSGISNLLLSSGETYRLVAVSGSDYYDRYPGGNTYSSDFIFNNYIYSGGSSLEFISSSPFHEYDYAMGNFQYSTSSVAAVPEPSTIALMAGGLGLVGFMANRRRKIQV